MRLLVSSRLLVSAIIFSCIMANPPSALAVNVTICDEAEVVLTHPAEYVQEKVKKGGLSCLIVPQCCTPAWVLDPVCYHGLHGRTQ